MISFESLIAFIFGGFTLPAILESLKKVLHYHTWRIASYKRQYDPFYEFYPQHFSEIDEHVFILENDSSKSWIFKDAVLVDEAISPYLFVGRVPSGLVHLENEESFHKVDPSFSFDGTDYPVGSSVFAPKESLRVTLENIEDLSGEPVVLVFECFYDTNSLWSKFSKAFLRQEIKVKLTIP